MCLSHSCTETKTLCLTLRTLKDVEEIKFEVLSSNDIIFLLVVAEKAKDVQQLKPGVAKSSGMKTSKTCL